MLLWLHSIDTAVSTAYNIGYLKDTHHEIFLYITWLVIPALTQIKANP